MSRHPDILAIDAVRSGEGSPADAVHVRDCAECRVALADLESLASALSGLEEPAPPVPAEVDAAILWQARKRALAIRRRPWQRPAYGIAAAAVVLLTVASLLRTAPPPASHPPEVASRAKAAPRAAAETSGDVDGDGRVDILDAFALARAVETHAGGRDVNGDGIVDERDVGDLAARAVSLGGA